MFKPLAVAATAGLLFTLGCEKQDPEAQAMSRALSKIPTVAPREATNPQDVLEHLQYAMVRNDPKHLEVFAPQDKMNATTQWFYSHSGDLGLALTTEEINTLGLQDLVKNGYLSDRWTRREFLKIRKEVDEGKRKDFEPGMERINDQKLDMPLNPGYPIGTDKKTADARKKLYDTLDKQRNEVLDANPKLYYATGLYRLLKCVPPNGWPVVTASVHNNKARSDMKDILLSVYGDEIAALAVGKKSDGTMFISYVRFGKYPEAIAKLFPSKEEASDEGAGS
jgi:hypothetical protein